MEYQDHPETEGHQKWVKYPLDQGERGRVVHNEMILMLKEILLLSHETGKKKHVNGKLLPEMSAEDIHHQPDPHSVLYMTW